MKLLVLARSSSAFAEWRDHLAPLSQAGWEVVFAAEAWKGGIGDAELRATLWHDPAWSQAAVPRAEPRLPRLAGRARRRSGRLERAAYAALSASPELDSALAALAPDVVAVLDDGKSSAAFGPLLSAAARRGLPRVLLGGWEPISNGGRLQDFTDVALPDAALAKRKAGCRPHALGPLVRPAEPDAAAASRERLLAAAGLDPSAPYLLYLRADEAPAQEGAPDAFPALLGHARAAGLQVVVVPPQKAKGAHRLPEAEGRGRDWAVLPSSEERPTPNAVVRTFRALAGAARLVAGESTPLLLDAAAAGLPTVALPGAAKLLERARQTERFGAAGLESLDALGAHLAAPEPLAPIAGQSSLAEVLSTARAKSAGRLATLAGTLGRTLLPAHASLGAAPPLPRPAVVRKVAEGESVNLDAEAIAPILQTLAASDRPILVGPWIAEVGFEVLYWIPFVRWCVRRFDIDPARLFVCSRGGVESWYSDLRPRGYLDIFDLMDEAAFRDKTMARFASSGGQKHMELGELDDTVAEAVRARCNADALDWLHPQLMFRFYRAYWQGRLGHRFLDEHAMPARFRPDAQTALEGALPEDYVAVRFYFRPSFEDTPENRAFVTRLVSRLAERRPVVLMDTGLKLDDHDEFAPLMDGNVHRIGHLVTGRNNLAIQSEVIRRSQMFVGTYGGLSYIPAFHGVPALAVSSDVSGFLAVHLQTAVRVFHQMGQSFTHTMRDELDALLG
jgi:hypothetical protein